MVEDFQGACRGLQGPPKKNPATKEMTGKSTRGVNQQLGGVLILEQVQKCVPSFVLFLGGHQGLDFGVVDVTGFAINP